MSNSRGNREEGNLLLIVEAANILEGKRTRPNDAGKTGYDIVRHMHVRQKHRDELPATTTEAVVNSVAKSFSEVDFVIQNYGHTCQ